MINGIIEPNEPAPEETVNLSGILSGDSGEQANNIIADLNAKPAFMQDALRDKPKDENTSTSDPDKVDMSLIGEDGCIAIMETLYGIGQLIVGLDDYVFKESTIKQRGKMLFKCFKMYDIPVDVEKIIIPVCLAGGFAIDMLGCYKDKKRRLQADEPEKPAPEVK